MVDQLYRADIDTVTPAEWPELLGRFEDANIYQTWSYGAVRWGEKNLSHLVLRCGAEVVGVAQVRIIRPRFLNRGVAYVRWGPVCQLRGRELDAHSVSEMAQALRAEYAGKRRLFMRILPDAWDGSERAAVFRAAFSEYATPVEAPGANRTIVLNLAPTLEQLRKSLDQKWRNRLNRAEKNELTVEEGSGVAEYDTFAEIYRELWNRKKFDTTVDIAEFRRICESLPENLKLRIFICRQQGAPVSAIVCSAVGHTGVYLLGATNDLGLKAQGAYLLQWRMIKWLKENGFQHYDLGGIDPARNPGVYHFKKGFSGQDVSRMARFECCEDFLSSWLMKSADLARDGLPRMLDNFRPARRRAAISERQAVESAASEKAPLTE